MKNLVAITRERLETCPPIISNLSILAKYDLNITLICGGCNDTTKAMLTEKGIDVKVVEYHYGNELFKLLKLWSSLKFRQRVVKLLKNVAPDVVIIEGQGAFKIIRSAVERYNYILYVLELYGKHEKIIGKLIKKAAAVIMPEYNRAVIYQTKFGMKKRPYVLPNKPYFNLTDNDIVNLNEKYKDLLKVFKEKKVVLYQGIIAPERDLTNYIKAVNELGDEYEIVLLGKDWGALQSFKDLGYHFVHIDFITPPEYLIFTMNAYIGILTYDPMNLNCAYCAPNKLYEYSKYSLPMLGNDIPGLKYTISYHNMGAIVDECSAESIKSGIRKISENYDTYSKNSRLFYEEQDNEKIIDGIVKDVAKELNL